MDALASFFYRPQSEKPFPKTTTPVVVGLSLHQPAVFSTYPMTHLELDGMAPR